MELKVAFGTDDGAHFNDEHFGMAKHYLVYRFFDGGEEFLEQRENANFSGDESIKHGDPKKAKATSGVLNGLDVVVGGRFGPNITRLLKKFVCVLVRNSSIAEAIEVIRTHLDEIIEEKNKTTDRKHLIFKKAAVL